MTHATSTPLYATSALTSEGWQHNVAISIGADGHISAIEQTASLPAHAYDMLLPGMPNVHSHAFQYALAGLTEFRSNNTDGTGDHFWSWREQMYNFVRKLTPAHVSTIAHYLYITLLKAGYTSVAEFHYLHHQPNGAPYDAPAELSHTIVRAAQQSGIALTHLPVLYHDGNFGNVPASTHQQRFIHTTHHYLDLLKSLQSQLQGDSDNQLGIAFHSLRAVPEGMMREILTELNRPDYADCPIHIHVAEQQKEVQDCLRWSKKRPVEWLLSHANVNHRWCLVHATHMTADETYNLAASGAIAGLCPTTEANLGDGIFPATTFLAQGGRIALGSDSHIRCNPFAELQLLEYSQRLQHQQRAVLTDDDTPHVGRYLYQHAANGGAQAMGRNTGQIAVGKKADIIALDTSTHPLYTQRSADHILDTAIFALDAPTITDTWVGGTHVIQNGIHADDEDATEAFRATLRDIMQP